MADIDVRAPCGRWQERKVADLRRCRKRGVTLIEAVLFISIALGLIVGGIVFYRQASMATQTMSQARHVASIVTEVRGMLRIVPEVANYPVFDATLIAAGALPTEIVAATPVPVYVPDGVREARLLTAWGEPMAVSVLPEWTTGTAVTIIRVTMWGLPVAACSRLAVVDSGGSGVAVGAASVTWRRPRATYDMVPTANRHVSIGVIPPSPPPALDLSVIEVTPSYASSTCSQFSVDGKVELTLSYNIDS